MRMPEEALQYLNLERLIIEAMRLGVLSQHETKELLTAIAEAQV